MTPNTFIYTTKAKDGIHTGSWAGYAVTHHPYIFLLGFCRQGEDGFYFLLTPHPDSNYSKQILVGIQSLLLPFPEVDDAKHAVSRPIVAVKTDGSTAAIEAAAHQWIMKNLQKPQGEQLPKGLLIHLGNFSTKT